MKLNEIIEGLKILQKYYDNPDDHHVDADHDIIYVYATQKPVSEEDLKKLHEFGFNQPGFDAEAGEYSPDENWQFFP